MCLQFSKSRDIIMILEAHANITLSSIGNVLVNMTINYYMI